MSIKLNLASYCQTCRCFEGYVDQYTVQGDTVFEIICQNKDKCQNLSKHIAKSIKEKIGDK